MEKGILTFNSAGNDPFLLGTVASVAPWMLSVAASSTDRRIIEVSLGNGRTVVGNAVNSFSLNGTLPLVYGKAASTAPRCNELQAQLCLDGCLDNSLVKRKLCFAMISMDYLKLVELGL